LVTATLQIALLGSPSLTLDGVPVVGISYSKAQALVYYLASSGRPHSREALAALLWPDAPAAQAHKNLRDVLSNLRRVLPSSLAISRQTVALNDAPTLLIDCRSFEQALTTAGSALTEAERSEALRAAVALYRGDFLEGFSIPQSAPFEEWALLERERHQRLLVQALHQLAAYAGHQGAYLDGINYTSRLLAIDPLREETHRQLMLLLALSGQRGAALAHYQTCCRILRDELGLDPDEATTALYQRMLTGEVGGDAAHPSAKAVRPRHNLPAALTPFIGRERELAEIGAWLRDPELRLLTLTGAGGMGKSRLALELARARLNDMADGVYFVSLAPLSAPADIAPAIAATLGIPLHGGDARQALCHALRDKQLLLILDNCEHLLAGVGLASELLQAAPQIQIIATSRERLNLRGERYIVLQGLDHAPDARYDEAAHSAAVQLYVQSARRVQPNFRLGVAEWRAVQRICQLVQQMPLGIELAAAWADSMPLELVAAEVERSADFLAADWWDAPERQRSMRAVFDWSWRLLNELERQTLRQLALFRGGCSYAAAEVVLGASRKALSSLVHKSLLRWNEASDSEGRYEIHELLRQFAAEQLDQVPEERARIAERHSEFYLAFVAARERRLARDEPQQAAAEIKHDIDNIRLAWTWAASQGHEAAIERSATGIWQFYLFTGLLPEGEMLFEQATTQFEAQLVRGDGRAAQQRDGLVSTLLAAHASLLIAQGKQNQALPIAEQALVPAQRSEDAASEAFAALVQGQALYRKGLLFDAQPLLERAARLAEQARLGGVFPEALPEIERQALEWLCALALAQDHYTSARDYAEASLQMCMRLGKQTGVVITLADLVEIAKATGNYLEARRLSEEALGMARKIGFRWGEVVAQVELGDTARLLGEYGLAYALLEPAVAMHRSIGEPTHEAYAMQSLVRLCLLLGDHIRAREWYDRYAQLLGETAMSAREAYWGALLRALLAQATGQHAQALGYALQSWQMIQHPERRTFHAQTLIVLGNIQTSLNLLVDATSSYTQALAIYDTLGHAQRAAEAHAGLARVALAQSDARHALGHVETILPVLASHKRVGLDEPFEIYQTCYSVLAAHRDPRAGTVLHQAQQCLFDYASRIDDETLRRSFLENVPAHWELWLLSQSVKGSERLPPT
jgi:predicted ATPase/DNA-binding SARP family transcriptional activator